MQVAVAHVQEVTLVPGVQVAAVLAAVTGFPLMLVAYTFGTGVALVPMELARMVPRWLPLVLLSTLTTPADGLDSIVSAVPLPLSQAIEPVEARVRSWEGLVSPIPTFDPDVSMDRMVLVFARLVNFNALVESLAG